MTNTKPVVTLSYWQQHNHVPQSTASKWASEGKLPVLRSGGLVLLRGDTPVPGPESCPVRVPKKLPFISVAQWAEENGVSHDLVLLWKQRGHIKDADMYACGGVWLIRASVQMPTPRPEGAAAHHNATRGRQHGEVALPSHSLPRPRARLKGQRPPALAL